MDTYIDYVAACGDSSTPGCNQWDVASLKRWAGRTCRSHQQSWIYEYGASSEDSNGYDMQHFKICAESSNVLYTVPSQGKNGQVLLQNPVQEMSSCEDRGYARSFQTDTVLSNIADPENGGNARLANLEFFVYTEAPVPMGGDVKPSDCLTAYKDYMDLCEARPGLIFCKALDIFRNWSYLTENCMKSRVGTYYDISAGLNDKVDLGSLCFEYYFLDYEDLIVYAEGDRVMHFAEQPSDQDCSAHGYTSADSMAIEELLFGSFWEQASDWQLDVFATVE